jgi:hypothetical protein
MLSLLFPAATTSSTPADSAAFTASSSAEDFEEDPNEQLITLACWWIA